jgi:hypothetical protein
MNNNLAYTFVSLAGTLVTVFGNTSCAKNKSPEEGKPVALSPLNSERSAKVDGKSEDTKVAPQEDPFVLKAEYQDHIKLSKESFATGSASLRWQGRYIQSRCSEGVEFSTRFEGGRIVNGYKLFDGTSCDTESLIEQAESHFEVLAADGNTINLKHVKEERALFLPTDLKQANNADKPQCEVGWELGKLKDISNKGECKLQDLSHTRLIILEKSNTFELRWGTTSSQKQGEMDGSSEGKRHAIIEDTPYSFVGISNSK